jgi:hypothetical protein
MEVIMHKSSALLACAAALCVGMAVSTLPAEARRGGFHAGGHARHMHANVNRGRHTNRRAHRNVNRTVNRNVTRHVDRRYVYRNGRRGYWRNGVFVVVPAVAGAAYVASCAYEYNRWQSTGSDYWRNRYYACAR